MLGDGAMTVVPAAAADVSEALKKARGSEVTESWT